MDEVPNGATEPGPLQAIEPATGPIEPPTAATDRSTGPDVGLLGRALGDPLRLAILERLMGGAAAVSDLVASTGHSQPNVSNHLAVLRSAGLVRQSRRGRQVMYELAGPDVARLVEALVAVAHPRPAPAPTKPPLAEARTCYDHLAGKLGVGLFDALVKRGAIVPAIEELGGKPRPLGAAADASLGPHAGEVFTELGIDLEAVRRSAGHRRLAPVCLDWTEQRPHLGGALGAAIWSRSIAAGWVVPQPGTRAVVVTPEGRAALRLMRP